MMEERDRPLAARTASIVVPYFAAMRVIVSPATTVWVCVCGAGGAAVEALHLLRLFDKAAGLGF